MTSTRLLLGSGAALAAAAVLLPASAASAKTDYTDVTTLRSTCTVYDNLPGHGSSAGRSYTKAVKGPKVDRWHLGVRYTHGSYALVLDYAKGDWGYVRKSCLTHPNALDQAGRVLPDDVGTGGNGAPRRIATGLGVGKPGGVTLKLDENATIRDAPRAFVLGNLRPGDTFTLRGSSCPATSGAQWVYGYSSVAGRAGYVQAQHLPGCRH